MNAVSEIIARPILPMELVVIAAILAALAIGFSLWRGLKGAWLRFGAALTLIIALLDPALLSEDREGLSDVVALIIDESDSQSIEDRAEATQEAAAQIQAQIDQLSTDGAPIELRITRAKGDGELGTRLLTTLSETVADVAPARLAGAILLTDGAISDAERRIPAFSGDAPPPVHVLASGREDEFDRRLVIESAPAYGLVGDMVSVRVRVDQTGRARSAGRPAQLTAYVDGAPIRGALAQIGEALEIPLPVEHAGANAVELRLEPLEGELTQRNNAAAFTINGVRDRLRVLLVSGEPHAGERTWRNLLKSDPSVDLVHFTILRPPEKYDGVPSNELALIPFPTNELFEVKLKEFDLIVFDRYRHRGLLYGQHLANISEYVREGGAVLFSTGPAFAGSQSLSETPLEDILPAMPTSQLLETPYRPEVTELGGRHPVTRALPGATDGEDGAPSWGRWFRLVEVSANEGDVLMRGAEERPLLLLDREDEGRVALLTSDHTWLWARGYDGGGPQVELLRRLAHWLMKEPELEEDALTAAPADGGYMVERRSLVDGEKRITTTTPSGQTGEVLLDAAGPGLWRALVETEELGLHRIADAPSSQLGEEPTLRKAVAVVGPPSPKEFADPISTLEPLTPLAEATGGALRRMSAGVPEIRRIRAGRATQGARWIGLTRRDAYEVRGAALIPFAPSWALFGVAALFMIAAWRVEGR